MLMLVRGSVLRLLPHDVGMCVHSPSALHEAHGALGRVVWNATPAAQTEQCPPEPKQGVRGPRP